MNPKDPSPDDPKTEPSAKTDGEREVETPSDQAPSPDEARASDATLGGETASDEAASNKKESRPKRVSSRRKPWLPWVVVAGVLSILGVVAGFSWLTPKPEPEAPPLQIAETDQTAIVAYARALLDGKPTNALPPGAAGICGRHVFVELYRNQPKNYIYVVSDSVQETKYCLPEAIERAIAHLRKREDFIKDWAAGLDSVRLAVSVVSTPLKRARLTYHKKSEGMLKSQQARVGWRLHSSEFEMGKMGLYLRTEGETNVRRQWAPPMEAVIRARGREDNYIHLRKYTRDHLVKVGIKDSADEKNKPKVRAFAFRTLMMLEPAPRSTEPPLNPVRGNILYGRVDADDIYQTATRMTDYLVRVMDQNGRYDYEYYADSDTSSKEYNIVRHAGTAYSVLFSYRYSGDQKYLDAGLKAKDYMEQNLVYKEYKPLPYHNAAGSVPAPFPEPDGSIKLLALEMDKRASLGATALALLAFSQIPKAALEPEDAERIRHMVNFAWYLQCDTGGFYDDYSKALTAKCPDPQPVYYPGETLLALSSLYQVTPNPAYLRITEKSIGFELDRFEDGAWPDHWVMQALDLMQANNPEKAEDDDWADAALAMAEKYIAKQYLYDRDYALKPPHPELEGAVSAGGGPPRNTPTGSRSEAVAGVYRLMKRQKKTEEAEKLGDHLLAAAYYLAQELYRPENTYYLPDPEQALWGLRGSMIDQAVRIDFNQHALVAVWGAWEVALSRKGIGWPKPQGALKAELESKAAAGKLVTQWGTFRAQVD